MSEDLEITIIDYQQALDDAYKKGRESFLDDFGNATIPLMTAMLTYPVCLVLSGASVLILPLSLLA